VPGAWVSQTAARSFDVGLRGVNKVGNASVLVLLNGRRLFDPSLGYPTWTVLPINPAEIERIEVLRGPGSILYGADALTGVINIVTRRPRDHVGTEAAFASGWNWTPNVPGDGYPQSRINPAAKATLSGYLNYAYLHPLRESADPLRRLAFPRHLFSVGANYQLGARIRVQGDVHIATAVTLTSAIYQDQEIVAMSLRSPVQPIVNLRVGYLLDDSRTEIFALVSNGAAMARNPSDLRQFPNPVVNPIGTQLLIGLNLRTP
jgi:hypothetical protein